MIVTKNNNNEKSADHYDSHELCGITSFTTYPSGAIKDCKLNEYNLVKVGEKLYIPRYKKMDERKKENKTISFYESGNIKSIALEERSKVETSVGTVNAELITFYENGEIDSIFPLNGQIGFGWSMKDEKQLLEEMDFSFSFGEFTTQIIALRFFEDGSLKSMILWPDKRIELTTPLGKYPVRIGFRLYENGALHSFEPATPISIETPIGTIMAFDQHAVGVDADFNSVRLYPDGTLESLCTNSDIVVNCPSTKERTVFYQQLRLDMLSDEMVKLPIVLTFQENNVTLDNGVEKKTFSIEDAKFLFLHDGYYVEKKCSPGSDCSGCGASCM
jgi:preprotein translocase subunit Sec61beta